jgi:CheY-like chemotaxis protein
MSQKIKVLYVEDNSEDAWLLESSVEEYGLPFEITRAANGFEALDYLESTELKDNPKKRPDLVILDYSLPRINGIELWEEIRTSPDYREIPTVLFSSAQISNDKMERDPHSLHLSKPFDLKGYQLSLESILDFHRRTQSAANGASLKSFHPIAFLF